MTREEAIERIKTRFDKWTLDNEDMEAIQALIPELNESEDERTRVNLHNFFLNAKLRKQNLGVGVSNEKILAYLEKQKALSELDKYIAAKRTKPGFMFAGNDSVSWEELPLDVRKHDYPYYFIGDLDCYPFNVEKQKEQKPAASWTIQDAQPGDILNSVRVQATIIFKGFNPDGKHIDAYCALQKGFFIAQELPWDRDFEPATQAWKDAIFDAMVRKGYLWDADNKRLNKAVQKPAEWSDEDEEAIEMAIIALEDMYDEDSPNDTYGGHNLTFNEAAKRLKSLRPQPKQECSEKCPHYSEGYGCEISPMKKCESCEKCPHPHWKPSNEQMDALQNSAYGTYQNGDGPALRELYNDLKKLM